MKEYIGAVFLDYDGTLCDEHAGIYVPTDTTKKAVIELQQKGYAVILATGRALCYVPDAGIDFDGYVSSNGAYAEVDGVKIYDDYIDKEKLIELMCELDRLGYTYSLETNEICYAKNLYDKEFIGMLDNFKISHDVFLPIEQMGEPKAYKLLITYDTEENFEALKKKFEGVFVLDCHRLVKSADIGKYGITKGSGAAAIIEKLNINPENTYAFGDATNDLGIFKVVKNPVAMKIHSKELEEYAVYITDSVENEGIYKALVHFNLVEDNI